MKTYFLYLATRRPFARVLPRMLRFLRGVAAGDRRFLSLISMMLPHRGRAFLRHYLAGSGRPLRVSLPMLWAGDLGLAGYTSGRLLAELPYAHAGVVDVPQWRLADSGWRTAIGSIRMHWKRVEDGVELHFRERYEWRPGQNRITRPIHEAAAGMARCGAKAFDIIGEPARMSMAALSHAAARPVLPSDHLYM